MPRMHRLDRVTEVIKQPREELERPALAAKRFPDFTVILERAKRDQRVVGRASTEYLRP